MTGLETDIYTGKAGTCMAADMTLIHATVRHLIRNVKGTWAQVMYVQLFIT
jgi:hypothetical protein